MGTVFDLAALAELLGVPEADVVATTFRTELRRIFGPKLTAFKMSNPQLLRVCPACIAESRLISRENLLLPMHGCTRHCISLVERCTCGSPLAPFAGGEPFTCLECMTPWDDLPRYRLGPRDALRQRRIAHSYRTLLREGDGQLMRAAKRVIRYGRFAGRAAGASRRT